MRPFLPVAVIYTTGSCLVALQAYSPDFGERFVEKMLRGYEAVYKHITLTIHQINKFSST